MDTNRRRERQDLVSGMWRLYRVPATTKTNEFKWPSHYHEEIEIICSPHAEAGGRILIDGNDIRVDRGFVIFLAPMKNHEIDIQCDDTVPFFIVQVRTTAVMQIFQAVTPYTVDEIREMLYRIPTVVQAPKFVEDMASRIRHMTKFGGAAGSPAAAAESVARLMDVFSVFLDAPGVTGKMSRSDAIVMAVVDYLEQNSRESISMERLSKEFRVSRFYLGRVFKRVMGVGVPEYLAKIRVREACCLLKDGNHSVSEVAYLLGYEDPSYFSKVFQKIMGKSPRSYRESGAR